MLVSNPSNIFYLTGLTFSNEEREAFLLVFNKRLVLFTDGRYKEMALQNKRVELIEITSQFPFTLMLSDFIKQNKIEALDFEKNNLTFAEYGKIMLRLTESRSVTEFALNPTENIIENLRKIKSKGEIAKIKQACAITDQAFEFIKTKIRPGVTEAEVALELEIFIKKQGADLAFPPIVAFDKHSSIPHYQHNLDLTSDILHLKSNSLVLLDFGARYQGYCADMTRVIFAGVPSSQQRHIYKTILRAQKIALDLLRLPKPHIQAYGIDQAARSYIVSQGFPAIPHSLGHGVGINIHEAPRLSSKSQAELVPGMVFSIEPGIYLPGKFGIRIEDLVLLTKDGIEILNKSNK